MLYSTIMLIFKKNNKKLIKFDKELIKYKIKYKSKIDNEPFYNYIFKFSDINIINIILIDLQIRPSNEEYYIKTKMKYILKNHIMSEQDLMQQEFKKSGK